MAKPTTTNGAARTNGRTAHGVRVPPRKEPTPADLLDAMPPANLQIEKELIGALLLAESAEWVKQLEENDFHDPMHGYLFGLIKAAVTAGVPVDSEGALLQWMKRTGAVGRMRGRFGDAWAIELCEAMRECVPKNVPYYCRVLRELRKRRGAKELSAKSLKGSTDDRVSYERWRKRIGELLVELDGVPDL